MKVFEKLIFLPVILVSIGTYSGKVLADDVGIQSKEDLKAYLETFRESRSLLNVGQSRVSSTLIYQSDSNKYSIGDSINKTIGMQLGIEYGISKKINVYGSASVSNSFYYSNSSITNESANTTLDNNSYSIGAKYALVTEDENTPEIVLDISTSKNKSSSNSLSVDNKTAGIRFNAIKSFDPIILVGSIGAEYDLDKHDTYLNMTTGLAFGINDRIALGSSISYQTPLSGSFKEAKDTASLTGRVTITKGKNIIEPAISMGLTDFSPDMTLSLTWSRRFK